MKKPYADYEYYTQTYFGSTVPESAWASWSYKASMRIEYLTFGRTDKLDRSVLPDAVFDAVCGAAEVMYEYDARKKARESASSNGTVKSESNDGYSVSYAGVDSADESADAENCDNAVMDVISEYLAHTGLMFKGWSRKWDKEVST